MKFSTLEIISGWFIYVKKISSHLIEWNIYICVYVCVYTHTSYELFIYTHTYISYKLFYKIGRYQTTHIDLIFICHWKKVKKLTFKAFIEYFNLIKIMANFKNTYF